ncbi:MAG: hypothetical protein RMJ87_13590 [Cytophagales bacterium]|nr:hypothetical protein [Bernardetiaceae bacterium]MDW8206055.1 hypothetical protein [Cytophagales bacterium]
MKTILYALTVGFAFAANNFTSPENPYNCTCAAPVQTSKPLFICENRANPGKPIKCRVERGKITYLFTNKKVRADRYEFEVTATQGTNANKVFFTDLVIKDERSSGGTYQVLFYYATNAGYMWKISKPDYLRVSYNPTTNELSFEAVGQMKNFLDTKNGYAPGEVERIMKERFKQKGFSEENMIRAASAYFILNYTKAFQS